jgi:hypothetical protein
MQKAMHLEMAKVMAQQLLIHANGDFNSIHTIVPWSMVKIFKYARKVIGSHARLE